MNKGKGTVSQAEQEDAKERFKRIRAKFAEADRQAKSKADRQSNQPSLETKSESTLTKKI